MKLRSNGRIELNHGAGCMSFFMQNGSHESQCISITMEDLDLSLKICV